MTDRLGNVAEILPETGEEEIWKAVPGFSKYEGSSFGKIKNITTDHILQPKTDKNGYLVLNLYRDENGFSKRYQKRVSRIICETFYGPPEDPTMVCDHIDRCRCNDYYKNIHWATLVENRNNRTDPYKKLTLKPNTPVMLMSKEGEFIARYKNANEASEKTGLSKTQISANVNGQRVPFSIGYFITEEQYKSLTN